MFPPAYRQLRFARVYSVAMRKGSPLKTAKLVSTMRNYNVFPLRTGQLRFALVYSVAMRKGSPLKAAGNLINFRTPEEASQSKIAI